MPAIPRLIGTEYEDSTFVTDCGVPSAFDVALVCTNCTMCCEFNILMMLNSHCLFACLFVCNYNTSNQLQLTLTMRPR